MIKKMLVAIDGSEPAAKALDFALYMAEKCGAEVHIISVIPPINSIGPRAIATPPPQFYSLFDSHLEERLQTVLSEALKTARAKKPNLNVKIRLLRGAPAQKIVQTAQDEGFDVIVLGSRGLGGVEEFFLGSVSDRVADTSTCSVLIVK